MMIGILTPLLLVTSPLNPNTLIQELRNQKSEKTRTPAEDSINNAIEYFWEKEDGSDDTTEQKELLQLPSDGD